MDNYEFFKNHIKNMLKRSKEYSTSKQHKNELGYFEDYVRNHKLNDSILCLSQDQILQYFNEYIDNGKINSKSSLNRHIAALKALFNYLIEQEFPYLSQLGFISSNKFVHGASERLNSIKRKSIINEESINIILANIDKYLEDKNDTTAWADGRYSKAHFVRIYIKLNLLLPLKISEMFSLSFDSFSDNFEVIKYNGFSINIPQGLRNNLIDSTSAIKEKYGIEYTKDTKLFNYLSMPISSKLNTGNVSNWFASVFNKIRFEINPSKRRKSYQVEKIKKSAIYYMIKNGIDIIYISDLTGLGLESIESDLIFEYNPDEASNAFNKVMPSISYYSIF